MKIIPSLRLVFSAPFSQEQTLALLYAQTETVATLGLNTSQSSKVFEGQISGAQIQLRRRIGYRNSFAPIASGSTQEHIGKTRITLDLNLHKWVRIFMIVYLSIATFMLVGMVVSLIGEPTPFQAAMLIPLLILVGALAMMHGAFHYEARRFKEALRTIWRADIEKS